MDLAGADPSRGLTARLQYAAVGSNAWEDCPDVGGSVLTASYSGTGTVWTCEELSLDAFFLDYGDAPGLIRQVRIAVDYTMPDGSSGTVYSTDCGELYVYTGQYVEEVSVSYADNTVRGVFRIDTDLIDPGELTLSKVILSRFKAPSYYEEKDITKDAQISAFAADGTFSVTYPLPGGEVLDPDYVNRLSVEYSYVKDCGESGKVDWSSVALVFPEVPAFTAPTLDAASAAGADAASYSYVPFTVTVNDGTKYGDLTAALQKWNGSGYTEFTEGTATVSSLTLNKGDSTAEWAVTASSGSCLIADLAADNGFAIVRVKVGYTDNKGNTSAIYSDPMVVYKGTYVTPLDKESQYVGDDYINAYFRIDTDIVNIDKVQTVRLTVTDKKGNSDIFKQEYFRIDKDTGWVEIRGEVSYEWSDDETEPPYVTFKVELLYTDEEAGPAKVEWTGISSQEIGLFIKEYAPPELLSFSLTTSGTDSSRFRMPFNLQMNDAVSVTATLYYSTSQNGSDNPATGTDDDTVTLSLDNTTNPVTNWITSDSGECIAGTVPWSDDLPGAVGWYSIQFEYTMPDGTRDDFSTKEKAKYAGAFFEPVGVAGYADGNGIRCSCYYYPELTPKSQNVTVKSIRLIPSDTSVASEILLQEDTELSVTEDNMYKISYPDPELYLDSGTNWTMELTMNYSDGEIDWTTTKELHVVFLS